MSSGNKLSIKEITIESERFHSKTHRVPCKSSTQPKLFMRLPVNSR